MKVDLLEFFRSLEGECYCIVKGDDLLSYREGSDIDIFCFDMVSIAKKIMATANSYVSKGYSVSVNNEREDHWHIDLLKNNKIDIRFDLYSAMPEYKRISVKDSLFSSVVEGRICKEFDGVEVCYQSFIDELIIKYLEYVENYKLRPDKVRHLDYILEKIEDDESSKRFIDKLHFYTEFPSNYTVRKKNDVVLLILKEIVLKVRGTPIKQLPGKIINFISKR